MSLDPHSDYFTARPIGIGRSNPGDVRRLRRGLSQAGYGPFPVRGRPRLTPGLVDGVKSFQRDHGLETDGMILPGGPTEAALARAVQDTVPESHARPGTGHKPGEIDVALFPLAVPAAYWLAGLLAVGGSAAYLTGRELLKSRRRNEDLEPFTGVHGRPEAGSGGGALDENRSRHIHPNPVGSSLDLPNKEEYPSEPPFKLPKKEEFPATKPEAVILVQPNEPLNLPGLVRYPDGTQLADIGLVVEYSRGTVDGQQRCVKVIVDEIHKLLVKHNLTDVIEHSHGGTGYPDPKTRKREYKKERYVPGAG